MVEYLDLAKATGIQNAEWESFQLAFLQGDRLFEITSKARQIGWSWCAAADAVASSILYPNTPNVFVSISQDEAREKIRYARQIIDALDSRVRPDKFPIENQTELELPNGSRLISHPCKPPRGKGRLQIYLDEFAHYPIAQEIYTAAVPVVTRGGKLRIGSTPLGAQGKFWEIYSESLKKYPGFHRIYLPWWVARGLCKDTKRAAIEAPHMDTFTRVEVFGTQRLKDIFDNMVLEDFQQEYECMWMDESESWITWDEIRLNQQWAQQGSLHTREVKMVESEDITDVIVAADWLAKMSVEGRIEQRFAAGVDVGRRKNVTEITLLGADLESVYPYRLNVTLDRCKFDTQVAVLKKLIDMLPIISMRIDDNGLGMNLGENMVDAHPDICSGATFTNLAKREWATDMKLKFQRGMVPIPLNRDLAYQLHSVRKNVTASSVVTFTSTEKEHHADKFWALALALDAAQNESGEVSEYGEYPF